MAKPDSANLGDLIFINQFIGLKYFVLDEFEYFHSIIASKLEKDILRS